MVLKDRYILTFLFLFGINHAHLRTPRKDSWIVVEILKGSQRFDLFGNYVSISSCYSCT